jgi:hypothetical protein
VSGELQTVTFQAKNTNSSPPPLPYHIEQGLRGAVGTTRLPSELSRNSNAIGKLIAVFNFFGVLWILWPTPIVAAILASIIAYVSASLAGLFHGIPYLRQRRDDWTATNWRLLNLCLAISWAASAVIAYFLIFYPPTIPTQAFRHVRSLDGLRANLRAVSDDCIYRGYRCGLREELSAELADAKRENERAPKWEIRWPGAPRTDEDLQRAWLTYAAAVLMLGAAHGLSAYGSPFSAETGNAIWREPHTGYPGAGTQPPPKPADDQDVSRVFKIWLARCVKISPDPKQSVSIADAHAKYSTFCKENKTAPMDLAAFKARMKSDGGLDSVGDAYQGVTIGDGVI